MFGWLTERRRRRILEHPWPAAWDEILERNVAAYRLLDDAQRERLRQLAQVFVAEKHWEGAGGLELSDEIKVTIAAQGCMLLLGRDHDLFARLESIVVYPSTVVLPERELPTFGVAREPVESGTAIAGQALRGDTILVVWDDVVRGARDPKDGHNVVIHELAHIIDFLDGDADGAPPFETRALARTWVDVATRAFDALEDKVDRGARTGVLRAYGATNPAEFFAVATEAFFEKPRELARQHRGVYDVLASFYNLDLAAGRG